MTSVRLQLDQATLQRDLTGPNGMATQYVLRKTSEIRTRAVLYCPVQTGNLRNSITSAVRSDGMLVIGTVGTPVDYAMAVHEGTSGRPQRVGPYSARGRSGRTYMVPAHMRTPRPRQGKPFLRKALQDVMGVV